MVLCCGGKSFFKIRIVAFILFWNIVNDSRQSTSDSDNDFLTTSAFLEQGNGYEFRGACFLLITARVH